MVGVVIDEEGEFGMSKLPPYILLFVLISQYLGPKQDLRFLALLGAPDNV